MISVPCFSRRAANELRQAVDGRAACRDGGQPRKGLVRPFLGFRLLGDAGELRLERIGVERLGDRFDLQDALAKELRLRPLHHSSAADGALSTDMMVDPTERLAAQRPPTDPETGQPGFRWLGRLDDVINTGGLKVHPAALERDLDPIIRHHVGPRRWYLAGRPHDITGSEVTLILEGPQDPQLGPALLSVLANAHPHPDRPRNVVWMDRFEETATGKVRRC